MVRRACGGFVVISEHRAFGAEFSHFCFIPRKCTLRDEVLVFDEVVSNPVFQCLTVYQTLKLGSRKEE